MMKKLIIFICAVLMLACSREEITIVLPENADGIERLAAGKLQKYFSEIYQAYDFKISNSPTGTHAIFIGTYKKLQQYNIPNLEISDNKEGFVISNSDSRGGIITSTDSRGILRGVYSLAEKLGYAFVFSGDIKPNVKAEFDFEEWNFSDEPLVSERTVFNWHNFLSGCTGWDLKDWNAWTNQSQKMGYNTIMVHAYANNPIYTFEFNGFTKPVGFLTSSVQGRDWSTEHVNNVKRLPGGAIFDKPIFGSSAAQVPEDDKVKEAQELMKKVFQNAEERGVDVNIALDFDIVAGIPQNMVKTLPEADRFLVKHKGIMWMGEKAGDVWLPRPDKTEGFNYYKKQVKTILELYPQLDIFTLWKRNSGSVWVTLKLEQLPKEWQNEYLKHIKKYPEAELMVQSVASFAQAKLLKAYRKVFDDYGREDVRLSFGTWRWPVLQSMNEFLPEDISVYILDSEVIRGDQHLHNKKMVDDVAKWIKKGKVIPVIWTQHDDGAYIGGSLKAFPNFNGTLNQLKANGFGVIHWMTRPFDSFFIHHIKQVFKNTVNQSTEETFQMLAQKWFGDANAVNMEKYLQQWNNEMPSFGRETSASFIDKAHYYKFKDVEKVVENCLKRIQLLQQNDVDQFSSDQFQLFNFFLNYEIFVKDFYIEQDKYLKALVHINAQEWSKAKEIAKIFRPKEVLQQYAKTIEFGTATKGEKGLLFSMGSRWLPQFISLKQIVGQEAIRINFAKTSHEQLAQMPGFRTYHIDGNKDFWIVNGEKETNFTLVETDNENLEYPEIFENGILIDYEFSVQLKPFTINQNLQPGKYKLTMLFDTTSAKSKLNVSINNLKAENFEISKDQIIEMDIELPNIVSPVLNVKTADRNSILCGLILKKKI